MLGRLRIDGGLRLVVLCLRGRVASPLAYPTMLAGVMPLLRSGALPSQLGSPPFRPPRA